MDESFLVEKVILTKFNLCFIIQTQVKSKGNKMKNSWNNYSVGSLIIATLNSGVSYEPSYDPRM